jgi:hypothetical protein
MSHQAVVAFLKQATEDESLKQKLVEFAAQHGFEFTADELTDAALEKVVGGLGTVGLANVSQPSCTGSGPAPPVPVPYPNMSSASEGDPTTVKADGKPIVKGSKYQTSSGDEAGTG